jgi:shikimate 5-dehydrogenase
MHKIVISTEVVNTSLISEVQQLFQKNNIDKNYNYWQFEPRFNATIKAVTARANGLLIGFNATMPIKLNTIELTEIDAIWSCDFIVDKEYRKKGVGH